jgi:hypothetical protein
LSSVPSQGLAEAFNKDLWGKDAAAGFHDICQQRGRLAVCGARAADRKESRIAFLSSLPDNPMMVAGYSAFSDELRQHGWVEGQNLIIEYRYINDPKNRSCGASGRSGQVEN